MDRILVVSELFYPEGSGAEYATYLILKTLASIGYRVRVLTGTINPAPIDGVEYYTTSLLGDYDRVRRSLYTLLLTKTKLLHKLLDWCDTVYIPLASYKIIPVAKKLGKRVVVHVHNLVPAYYHGVKYLDEPLEHSLWSELRYGFRHEIYSMNSWFRALMLPVSYILYRLWREYLCYADTIVVVTKWHKRVLVERAGVSPKKLVVAYNPLPEIPCGIKPSIGEAIVYTGGSSILKGYPIALETLLELFKRGYRVEAIMAGLDNSVVEKLWSIKYKYKSIRLLPRIKHEKILELLANSRILLFPSIIEEPSPYSIVEAILLYSIPVAFKTESLREIASPLYREFFIDYKDNPIESFIEVITKTLSMDKQVLVDYIGEAIDHLYKLMSRDKIVEYLSKIF